jgi:glucokinase
MDQYYVYESVDLPLRELLEKESGLPVLIENDATCACFGECWLDSKSNYKNALYMFSGSGCGIMINGEIYTGKNGYAGEVTISNYKDRSMMKCQNGDDCYLSRWETDLGITRQVRDAFSADPSAAKVFSEKTCVQPQDMDLRSIFAAARSGEPVSREALGIAAGKLGVKISYLVNLFDPQAVVIGGGLEEAGDEFLNKVNSTIRDWSFREITDGLKVSYSQLRENAVALGAASLVMQRVFARLV